MLDDALLRELLERKAPWLRWESDCLRKSVVEIETPCKHCGQAVVCLYVAKAGNINISPSTLLSRCCTSALTMRAITSKRTFKVRLELKLTLTRGVRFATVISARFRLKCVSWCEPKDSSLGFESSWAGLPVERANEVNDVVSCTERVSGCSSVIDVAIDGMPFADLACEVVDDVLPRPLRALCASMPLSAMIWTRCSAAETKISTPVRPVVVCRFWARNCSLPRRRALAFAIDFGTSAIRTLAGHASARSARNTSSWIRKIHCTFIQVK